MRDNYLWFSARFVTISQSFALTSWSTVSVWFRPISFLSMAHQHSYSQPVRRSTRQKSSNKDADFLYPELPGEWQDFNFPDEEFLRRWSPSRVWPRRKRACLLLIALLQLPQTIFVLLAHVIWNWKSASLRPKTKSWLLNSKFCNFAELMAAQTWIPRISACNLPPKRHARKEQWTGRTNSPQVTFPLLITIN